MNNAAKFCSEIKKYTSLINPTVLSRVDSTNTYAKGILSDSLEGDCVFAISQTGGRGRLGRSFFSYEGGIYMSLILKPNLTAESSLFITTAAAVAVSCAIEELFGKETKIKWVNDIYIAEKKVCGILTEGVIGGNGKLEGAVLGIGINLGAPEEFPEEISSIADSILDVQDDFELKARLVAKIVDEFFEIYKNPQSKDYMKEYRRRSYLDGKTVEFLREGILHTAKVLGVTDEAGLKILEGGEEKILSAGEVSVSQIIQTRTSPKGRF